MNEDTRATFLACHRHISSTHLVTMLSNPSIPVPTLGRMRQERFCQILQSHSLHRTLLIKDKKRQASTKSFELETLHSRVNLLSLAVLLVQRVWGMHVQMLMLGDRDAGGFSSIDKGKDLTTKEKEDDSRGLRTESTPLRHTDWSGTPSLPPLPF